MVTRPFIITMFVAFTFISQVIAQKTFSESQLREDLVFFKHTLEKKHPNLYLYTTKERVDFFFDSLSATLNQALNEEEFYHKLTLTSDLIKDGHTLILPSNDYTLYHNTHSHFLPFQIGLKEDSLFIKMNCTKSKELEDGIKVDSINGMASAAIIQTLLQRQVRDGHNLSYARWILDTYFREYYSYHFGHPKTYTLHYNENGISQICQIPALPKDSIFYYSKINYPAIYQDIQNEKAISMRYDYTNKIPILTIKDFHSDILKTEYNQNFKKEIDVILKEIIKRQLQNLVIDLRNNQGGDVENAVYLLKYLISKPFKVVQQYQKVKNGKLVEGKGPCMGFHKPFKQQFTGKIFVLLNGGSFSNSVIFSSCLKENANILIAGSESGSNPNVLAGYPDDYELPNTKINVQIPTKRFIMTSLDRNDGRGLIPSYKIIVLRGGGDPQLEVLLYQITRKKSEG